MGQLKNYVRELKREIAKRDRTVEMIKERIRDELREQGLNGKEIKELEDAITEMAIEQYNDGWY